MKKQERALLSDETALTKKQRLRKIKEALRYQAEEFRSFVSSGDSLEGF